jgi:flavin-dependent dehydrogenase
MGDTMPDVVVVGAGPAGSAAAKRCAERGLDTVILERRMLPRDKVCSGMIIGPLAQTLVRQEFGDIPDSVLSRPSNLKGYMFHSPDGGSRVSSQVDFFIPLAWRRNLDFWMSETARGKGVQILPGARVTGIEEKGSRVLVRYQCGQESGELEAGFVIGADGSSSIVRKSQFPELQVAYGMAYEELHRGNLDLDPGYFHWFPMLQAFPGGFAVHQKDDHVVLEFGGTVDVPKERIQWAKGYLAANHGFNDGKEPVWRGGCTVSRLAGELISGSFLPARKNILLAGDAGGFVLPITGEGIGTCLQSGLLAADAVVQALRSGCEADGIYLKEIAPIVTGFRNYSPWIQRVVGAAKAGGDALRDTFAEAHRASLALF